MPYSPSIELLDRVGADFSVHGDDMPTNEYGVGAYDAIRDAGRLKIVKRTEGVSTYVANPSKNDDQRTIVGRRNCEGDYGRRIDCAGRGG